VSIYCIKSTILNVLLIIIQSWFTEVERARGWGKILHFAETTPGTSAQDIWKKFALSDSLYDVTNKTWI
jgi:hypothetical protein